MAKVPEEFWKSEWALQGLNAPAGRKMILKDITST